MDFSRVLRRADAHLATPAHDEPPPPPGDLGDFQPSSALLRKIHRERYGLVEVLVNHKVDGVLIEHRSWVSPAATGRELLKHQACPGSIVGVIVDGRVVPC